MKKIAFLLLCLILIIVAADRLDLFSSFNPPDINRLDAAIERQYEGLATVESISAGSAESFGSREDRYQKISYTARIKFSDHVVATKDLNHLTRLSDFFDLQYRQCRYLIMDNISPEKVDPLTKEISLNLLEQCARCLEAFNYYKTPFLGGSVYAVKGVAVFEKYMGDDWRILRFTIKNPRCLTRGKTPDWLKAANYMKH